MYINGLKCSAWKKSRIFCKNGVHHQLGPGANLRSSQFNLSPNSFDPTFFLMPVKVGVNNGGPGSEIQVLGSNNTGPWR